MPSTAPQSSGPPPPASLVGRAGEWAAITARCQQAVDGKGGLLLLSGEAGIGKTALLCGLRDWAATARIRVMWATHLDLPIAPPLHGLREAMAQLLGVASTDTPSMVGARARMALQRHWPEWRVHRQAIVRLLRPSAGPEPVSDGVTNTDQTHRLHDLMCRLLSAKARECPVLVVLDDCHWADVQSLHAVAHVAGVLATERVLLVGAYRPEEQTPATTCLAGLAGRRGTDSVAVSRLSSGDVGHLLRRRCGEASAAAAVTLHMLTGGIPLYLEQLLEWHAEMGVPVSSESLTAPLPRRIVDLVQRRLVLLSDQERAVLHAAAVAGDPFSATATALALDQPLAACLALLAQVANRGLIDAGADGGLPGERFWFHHPLLRRVAYESMPGAQRLLFHGRLAMALAARCADEPEALFAAAGHLQAVGAVEQGAAVLLGAGRRALSLGAATEAQAYLERALTACGAHGHRDTRAECEMALGDTHRQLGNAEIAHTCWETALRHQDSPSRRVGLYLRLAGSPVPRVLPPGGQWRYLQAALRETAASPTGSERAEVLVALVGAPSPGISHSLRCACEAVRHLRAHPVPHLWPRLLRQLATLHDRRYLRMERRRRLLRRAVRQAERYELWDQAIECRAGLALLSRHDLDAALGELEAAHRLASACLPPGAQGLEALLCSLVCVHTAKGQMQSARRYAALLTGADGEPAPLAGTDPTDAEALWQARQRALGDLLAHGFPTSIDHANVYSRYRRQACQLGRQAEADSFLADLRAAHPKAVVPEEPTPCQSPWGLPMPAPDAITRDDTCPRPIAGVVLGLAALTWRRATTDDLCSWPAPEQVEICPGSEAGLGVLGLAPCLLTEVADDFVLEVCVGRGRPEPRGGGAVVFSGAERLRFASGVDHAGQVSLCRCGGVAPCCHTVGYLGEGGTWLRLRRQGRVYAALASTDQRHWFHCGEAEFGLAGPVQVGIFAEPSHELSMPLPYPTRLADFRLWVAADMPSTARDPDAAVARAQSWADVGGPGLRTTEQEVTANAGVPRNGRPARCALYPLPRPTVTHGMVGQSLALRRFLDLLERLAGNASPLLITGETGTGKELAAQAVHTLSPRRHGPFVPVNVATLAPALVESELFGHRRGSFTGASEDRPGIFVAANGGTLFLDEIGELQLPHQAKLLRALDSGDIRSVGATRSRLVDVRCVAATNRDLPQAVAASAFRLDLLYRLGQQLTLPPLRARRDDLPALVAHFLSALSSADPPTVTVEAMAALAAHDWPGNIRELRAVLEAGVALAGKGPLALEHLRLGATGPPARPRRFRIGETPSAAEVAQLLRACDGDVQAVSRSCGVSRNTVYRWLRRWQITPGTWR